MDDATIKHSRLTCTVLYSLTKVRRSVGLAWATVVLLAYINLGRKIATYGVTRVLHLDQGWEFWSGFSIFVVVMGLLMVTVGWLLTEFHHWAVRKYERDC
jgi:hypothetical protein